jgi:amino acid permease
VDEIKNTTQNSENQNEIIPSDDNDSEENIVHHVKSTMQALMMTSGSSSIFADKLNTEHLTKIIENKERQDEREFRTSRDNKVFILVCLLIVFAFVLIFCLCFKNDIDMIKTIVIPVISIIIGGLGGYGLGYKKGLSSEDK